MNRLLSIFFLFATTVAWGQTDKRYIEVIGSAETDIDPNIIVITVQLREYDENKTKVTLDKIEADFNAALTKSNVPKENVRLANLSSDAYRPRKRDRDAYFQKIYEVTFSRSQDVLSFLTNAAGARIESIHIVKLSHTEIQKFRLETKVAALNAAEMKAEVLLNAVGSKRGKVLLIEERSASTESFNRSLDYTTNQAYFSIEGSSEDSDDMPLKKIHLRFEILARFEIE